MCGKGSSYPLYGKGSTLETLLYGKGSVWHYVTVSSIRMHAPLSSKYCTPMCNNYWLHENAIVKQVTAIFEPAGYEHPQVLVPSA